jgi:virulence factor Mce-like protein
MVRKAVGPIALAALVVGMFFGLKARYGNYNHYYYVKVNVARAGQLLRVGTDVRERGVVIGKVSDIALANPADNNPHAELTLQIEPQYRIPQNTQAFVDLKTLLGDKYVDLRSQSFSGPWLHNDARITGQVGPELEDVLQSGVHIFNAIRPTDLATVVGNLAQAAQGHGQDVARNIQSNAQLSTIFASTLPPQLRALRDFDVIFLALKSRAVDLNRLADMVNQGAPVYASARAHRLLDQALAAVTPFAQNLADLLIYQKSDWDRMMSSGDAVLQTISLHAQGLHDLIHGLYVYVHKLGGKPPYLSDGSGMAPFSNFSGGTSFTETIHQLCGTLPPQAKSQIPICKQPRYSH